MDKKKGQFSHRLRAFCSKPSNLLLIFFLVVLFCLSVLPLLTMLSNMFIVHLGTEKKILRMEVGEFTWNHFQRLFPISDWSIVNFWVPLKNSLIVASGAGILGIIIGGVVAWFITRSSPVLASLRI